MKKLHSLACVFFTLLLVACGKEESRDYRDAWVGDYAYSYNRYSWNPRGSGPSEDGEGLLRVDAVEDSNIRIMFKSDQSSIICKVSADGQLAQKGDEYRAFLGNFISPDSLYFHCANFSPASGTGWDYYCKKTK